MSNRAVVICSLLAVALIWGSAFVVTKAVETQVPPLTLALLRFVLACALLLPLTRAQGGLHRRLHSLPWGILAGMGLTGVTLYFATSNLGLVYTTASDAALIQGAIPAATAVLAVLVLEERLDLPRAAGIGLSIVGVALIVLTGRAVGDAPQRVLGDALMFGSVLAWSVYTILGKGLQHLPPLAVTAYSTLLGTVFLLPASATELALHPPRAVSLGGWLAIVYLGAISSALAYVLWNRGSAFLDASQHANFLNLVPVVGAVSGVLFLRETLSPFQIGGGIMVLIGVWLTARRAAPTPAD